MPMLAEHGVTRLARITGLDRIGIPVWNAIRPNARSIAIHQGKGINDIDAKVSAVMEAVERSIAEKPPISGRHASRGELEAAGLRVESMDCLIGTRQKVVERTEAIDWVEGLDLITSQAVWVPRDTVTLDRTAPSRYWQSSDGLASGNTIEEAMFHGLLERVERDAETLWKLDTRASRSRCCVDARSFEDPVVNELIDRINAAGFHLQLFDVTSDIGIPVFSAFLAPVRRGTTNDLSYIDVTTGSGAHLDAARAAIRAITEAVQSRLTLISGARDDVAPDTYFKPLPEHISWLLRLEPKPLQRRVPALCRRSIADMLEVVLARLVASRVGTVICVRLNPGDDRLAVTKVLVPKLENPEGARQQVFGSRALSKILVFR